MKRWAPRIFSLSLVLAVGCGGDDPDEFTPTDFGYDYLPLTVGDWIEYKVDSTVYDDFTQSVDTFTFFHREQIVESYDDLEGREVYRVERFRKESEGDTYRRILTFELLQTAQRAERKAFGQRIVPLTYPVSEGRTWDANAFNTDQSQDYEYLSVDDLESINGLDFQQSVRVLQANDTDNFVIREYAEERYARGIGLIYQENLFIETQFGIDSGLHMIRSIVDWSRSDSL